MKRIRVSFVMIGTAVLLLTLAVFSTTAQTQHVKGTVKWFNAAKGMGFVTNSANGRDYVVHKSSLTANCNDTLHDGQAVEFDIGPGKTPDPKGNRDGDITEGSSATAASAANVTCK